MVFTKDEILSVAVAKAQELGLDHELVLAIIEVESAFDPFAHRFEPAWRYCLTEDAIDRFALHNRITPQTERIDQMTSFGVMQIMGSVAREFGFQSSLIHLIEPQYGIHYGCVKLKSLVNKYPNNLNDAISAYNAGTPVIVGGLYRNQRYVDDVNKALEGKLWTINQKQGA